MRVLSAAGSGQPPETDPSCCVCRGRTTGQEGHIGTLVYVRKKTLPFYFGGDRQHPLRVYMQNINESNTF